MSSETTGSLEATYDFFCASGLLKSVTRPGNRTDSYDYDVWGRLKEEKRRGIRRTTHSYNDQASWILQRGDIAAYEDGKAASVLYLDDPGREWKRRVLESAQTDDTAAVNESDDAIMVDTKDDRERRELEERR